MSDDSTWDEFTAAGYGPAELMALTIQGSLAAGSTMTITLPINISALAGAPTDGSETIQTAGLDLEASPTFFGARGSSLVLSSWLHAGRDEPKLGFQLRSPSSRNTHP